MKNPACCQTFQTTYYLPLETLTITSLSSFCPFRRLFWLLIGSDRAKVRISTFRSHLMVMVSFSGSAQIHKRFRFKEKASTSLNQRCIQPKEGSNQREIQWERDLNTEGFNPEKDKARERSKPRDESNPKRDPTRERSNQRWVPPERGSMERGI